MKISQYDGNNIAFNKGEYSPDTQSGKRLLAHELTRKVQQGAARGSREEGSVGERQGVVVMAVFADPSIHQYNLSAGD